MTASADDEIPPARRPDAPHPRPRVEIAPWQIVWTRRALRALGAVAPALTSRVVLRLFRTIRRHRTPEREGEWLRSAERFSIDSAEGRLAAASWGSGAPVLLAHGWEGRGSQMGGIGTALAAGGRRAVAYDAPGHGESDGSVSSLFQFAGGAKAMVERVGPLAGFVGHSFGAAGICFALWRGQVEPQQIGRLVFIAPPGDLHLFIRFFERMLGLSQRVSAGYEAGLEEMLGVPWAEARHCTTRGACALPLLVLHDEEDRDTPIEDARTVVEAWPDARLVTTRGLGHRRILRDPSVARQVTEFLTDES